MPDYRREGKITTPITDEQFSLGMETGTFLKQKHQGYTALLYYTAVRKMEGLRTLREQITLQNEFIYDVGKRLKHGIVTPPLNIPIKAAYAETIWTAREATKQGERIWPYSPKTGYNIVNRAFKYPHLFRLSRITRFFLDDWSIAQVKSWTGLTLEALNYYVGVVDIQKMGQSLIKKTI
jgi:integrase